jgi:hypothetical protein
MSGAEFAFIIGAIAASGDVIEQVRAVWDTVGNLSATDECIPFCERLINLCAGTIADPGFSVKTR